MSLNAADLKVVSGKGGGKFLHKGNHPFPVGFDFSGLVEGSDRSVFGFLPYDGKTTQGTLAELIAIPEAGCVDKPEGVTHVDAACLATAGSTAYRALHTLGGATAGTRVLINGASGGVGSYAVQIAKKLGAEVWATCSAAKMDRVREWGADHVIDYRTPGVVAEQGVHLFFDVSNTAGFGGAARALVKGGAYICTLPLPGFVTGKIRSLFSSKRCLYAGADASAETLTTLANWVAEGDITTPLDDTVSFDGTADALARLESRRVTGKIAILV